MLRPLFAIYEIARKRSGKEGLLISTCLLELRVEALDFFTLYEIARKRSGK